MRPVAGPGILCERSGVRVTRSGRVYMTSPILWLGPGSGDKAQCGESDVTGLLPFVGPLVGQLGHGTWTPSDAGDGGWTSCPACGTDGPSGIG